MKKFALALVATSALSLAACDPATTTNASNTAGATTNEAIADVNSAVSAEQNTTDALNQNFGAMANESAGNTSGNTVGGNSSGASTNGAAGNNM